MRILLVDDHKIFRDGLKSCLAEDTSWSVVGEADNGRLAVEKTTELKPDVIVMDIAMPGLNGVDAARQILSSEETRPKLVILSSYSDPEFVTEVLRIGADGYILKNAAFDELVSAIETIADGKIYLSPEIAGLVVDVHIRDETIPESNQTGVFATLTEREREVVQLIAEGVDAKGIAARLDLSPKTIHAMRNKIMSKLDIDSVADLIKYAIRVGLTSLDG